MLAVIVYTPFLHVPFGAFSLGWREWLIVALGGRDGGAGDRAGQMVHPLGMVRPARLTADRRAPDETHCYHPGY